MKAAMNAGVFAFFRKALLSTTLLALSAGAALAQNKVVFQIDRKSTRLNSSHG